MEKYRAFDDPWPWYADPEAWKQQRWDTIWLVIFNLAVCVPVFGMFNWFVGLPASNDFTEEGLPGMKKFFIQVMFCAIVEDFTFHMAHRLNHTPFFYSRIHKIHHRYKIVLSCATVYCHPLEMLICNIIPTVLGPIILDNKIHITAMWGWLIFRTIESIIGHSGYEFPCDPYRLLPLTSDYGAHVYHHSHNVGNYSSFFSVWDTIFGSNKAYKAYLEEFKKDPLNKLDTTEEKSKSKKTN